MAEVEQGSDRRPRVQREVVSYVRRSARMRPPQRMAWDRYSPRFLLEVPRRETSTSVSPEARLDLAQVFGRTAPLVVEIGPGTGDSLIPMAAARPGSNVLAFEVYRPAIAQILARIGELGLTNVRLVEADAAAGLEHLVPPAAVEELWTFFPDPWPKSRHHKRRLVDAAFAARVVSRLRPGGRWRLATDWPDYAAQMMAVLDAQPGLVNEAGRGAVPRWPDRPITRFEERGAEAGRPIVDLSYRRG